MTYRRAIVEVVYGFEDIASSALCNITEEVPNGHLSILADMVHVLLYCFETIVIHNWCQKVEEQGLLDTQNSQEG